MIKQFYIGLSLLSNRAASKALHNEGRRILSLLDNQFGLQKNRSDEEPLIETETGGRPYYADHHADFSISHSRNIAAAAYLAESGKSPVVEPPALGRTGCDIQYIDPKKTHENIAARFFTQKERSYIAAGPASEQSALFCHIWALKEAYLKLKGLSIAEIEKAPEFLIGEKLPSSFYLYELGNPNGEHYALAAAIEKLPEPAGCHTEGPDLLWFSREALPLRSIAEIYAVESPEKTVSPKI
jgi:phosphopantetheinyl transferase